MRWWLLGAGLGLLVVLTVPDVRAGRRAGDQERGSRRGKRKRDGRGETLHLTFRPVASQKQNLFDSGPAGSGQTREGRSRPLKIRLVPGPVLPEIPRPNQGNSGFLNFYRNVQEQQSSYSVIPGQCEQNRPKPV